MLRSIMSLVDLVIGIGLIVVGTAMAVTTGLGALSPVVAWLAGAAFIAFSFERRLRDTKPARAKQLKVLAAVFMIPALAILFLRPNGKKPGQRCSGEVGTCTSNVEATSCQDGTVMTVACRGPKGCYSSRLGLAYQCDTSVASVGDRCINSDEGRVACNPDKRLALQCKHHVYELLHICDGEEGCVIADAQLRCAYKKDTSESK